MSKNINQQFNELNEILAWFEQPNVDVEEALSKFEQGIKLTEEIKKRLDVAENKIKVLKQKFEA